MVFDVARELCHLNTRTYSDTSENLRRRFASRHTLPLRCQTTTLRPSHAEPSAPFFAAWSPSHCPLQAKEIRRQTSADANSRHVDASLGRTRSAEVSAFPPSRCAITTGRIDGVVDVLQQHRLVLSLNFKDRSVSDILEHPVGLWRSRTRSVGGACLCSLSRPCTHRHPRSATTCVPAALHAHVRGDREGANNPLQTSPPSVSALLGEGGGDCHDTPEP